ncbi:MAG: GNAT family N-acetyltransferase [Blautia sp.]|jgi:ribosomal protein S18 acetylase RimI-like enzyme
MVIRDIKREEKDLFFQMAEDFYSPASGACLFGMNREHMENTFALCMEENPYARLLLVEDGEEILGFCMLSFTWSNEVGGLVVLLEELYFKEEARGKGYGKQVMSWVEKEYPKARRFRLEATKSNQGAIGLYEKMGYQELPYYQMVKDKG